MKVLMVVGVVCGLVPALAQHTGGHAGGSVPAPMVGLPSLGPLPPLVGPTPPAPPAGRGSRDGGRRSSGNGFWYGYPAFYDGYDGGSTSYSAAPGVVIVMPAPAQPEKPPEPPQPVVHEYAKQWAPEPAGGTAPEFSIVGTDGLVRFAIAAWVQSDVLHYVDPEGGPGQMPLSAVNRASTRRANAAKGLTLQLPAPAARPTL